MSKRDISLFIADIIDGIRKINEFVEGMDLDGFIKDDKTSSAVIRKLEIIGEATKNIPRQVRQRYKDIPWTDLAKMRDKMAHFYFGVDHDIVWKVIKERLPAILQSMEQIAKDLKAGK